MKDWQIISLILVGVFGLGGTGAYFLEQRLDAQSLACERKGGIRIVINPTGKSHTVKCLDKKVVFDLD